jgi:N-acylneuraminate cytidylyltransferase
MANDWRAVALIPARGGSQRCPGKNLRRLNGHPLVAHAIAAAQQSGLFAGVYVSSEDEDTLRVASAYGATALARAADLARHDTPDYPWVRDVIVRLHPRPHIFAIVRPTNPFRTGATMRRAWRIFREPDATCDSVRAVQPVTEHPGKMWTWAGPGYPLRPYVDRTHPDGTPWHSSPTQALPPVYVQNAALDLAWSANVFEHGTIAGRKVAPLFTEGLEGVNIDTEEDWERAVRLAAAHPEALCLTS